jgi:hypothetical protein
MGAEGGVTASMTRVETTSTGLYLQTGDKGRRHGSLSFETRQHRTPMSANI